MLEPFENLPKKIKIHSALVGYPQADSETSAKAKEILPSLFIPELSASNFLAWENIFSKLQTQYDRKTITKTFIDFLQELSNNISVNERNVYSDRFIAAARIIWTINIWYGQNFGGLGTGENTDARINSVGELKSIISSIINWFNEDQQAKPLDLAFIKGKIVDTSQNPIPRATITIHWNQTVINEGVNKKTIQREEKISNGQ